MARVRTHAARPYNRRVDTDARPTTAANQREAFGLAFGTRFGMILGPLAILGISLWLAGRTGPDVPGNQLAFLAGLARGTAIAGSWIAAAAGFGLGLRRLLRLEGPAIVAIAMGVAALLAADATLGRLGILVPTTAWALVAIGCALLGWECWRTRPSFRPPGVAWLSAPAVATLLVASASTPGWLWQSEFGGYDALAYHLQLPREWIASGAISPAAHTAYSHLPNLVEAAFMHLAVLGGGVHASAESCQVLHAGFAILTAWAVASLAVRLLPVDSPARAKWLTAGAGFVLVLSTPWVVVCGSLAYDELAVTLMLAAGLLVAVDARRRPVVRGAVTGLLAAAACGAKLTAAGLAAGPLALALLMMLPRGTRMLSMLAAACTGTLIMLPWLVSNGLATGNPFFPFATDLFGHWNWTPEQLAIWNAGHGAGTPLAERVSHGFNEFLRPGLGPAPADLGRAPWLPQWSLLPLAGAAALVVALVRTDTRRAAIPLATCAVFQIVFWIAFTHVKGRFMLPAVVPLATTIAIVAGLACSRSRRATPAVVVLLLVAALLPPALFLREQNGAPAGLIGWTGVRTGDSLNAADRAELATVFPAVYVNHGLPEGARVLLIGEAAPFYYDLDRIEYVTTWNRGRLARAMDEFPGAPNAWFSALREAGFTHVLINPVMLEVWAEAGWNDPRLTPTAILGAAEAHLVLDRRYPSGLVIYALQP